MANPHSKQSFWVETAVRPSLAVLNQHIRIATISKHEENEGVEVRNSDSLDWMEGYMNSHCWE